MFLLTFSCEHLANLSSFQSNHSSTKFEALQKKLHNFAHALTLEKKKVFAHRIAVLAVGLTEQAPDALLWAWCHLYAESDLMSKGIVWNFYKVKKWR